LNSYRSLSKISRWPEIPSNNRFLSVKVVNIIKINHRLRFRVWVICGELEKIEKIEKIERD
jgi:hypothetical protein